MSNTPPARITSAQEALDQLAPSRYFWREGRLRRAAFIWGLLVGAMALIAIVGWFASVHRLVQLRPGYVALQFNTALCLLLASGSLVALTARRNRIAVALSIVALVLSGSSLAQNVTGRSTGVDGMLWMLGANRDAMGRLASFGLDAPGRMAPNSAVALVLLAIALLIAAPGRMTNVRFLIASVSALAAAAMGAVALAGYLLGMPTASGWGQLTHMSLQGAVMLTALGLATLCGAILNARRAGLNTRRVIPGLTGATVAITALLLWAAIVEHDRRNLEIAVRHQANAAASAIARSVDDRARIVDRLSQRAELMGGVSASARSQSSTQLIRDFPGITAITWLDTAGRVTWRMAEHPTDAEAVGTQFATTLLRASLLHDARGRNRGVVSPPMTHGHDEATVLIAASTSAANGIMGGYLIIELVPARVLTEVLPEEFIHLYDYVLEDGGVTIAGQVRTTNPGVERWGASLPLDIRGRPWRLTVIPTRQTLDEFSSPLPTTFLVAAMVCALFAAWIVRSAQRAAEQSAQLAQTVGDLAAENEARREAELLLDEHTDMLQVQATELEIQYTELQTTATELEKQRDEIGRAQEFSAALVRSTVDAVAAFDVEGRVHAWNPAMASLTGRAHELADDAVVGTLLPFLAEGEELRLLQEALAGRATTMHALEAAHQDSNTEVALDLTVTPMCASDGSVVGGLLVARDVTEQQRVAELIIASKEAAEASNRAKSDFLARMSHELRTPLNAVIGFTNVIRRNVDNHLRKTDLTYLDRIGANGRHLLALIDTVLDISKIESGRETAELAPVQVSSLVRDTMGELEVRATEAGLHLHITTPWGAEATTDQAKLKQVLINLVGNAIKFTPRDGHMFVRVETDAFTGAATRIDVEDTGIGIPADRLEAIFEAFEQADPQIAHTYGGTGLGLSISRKLCALMGHELVVTSEPGKGSRFSILLRPQRAAVPA